MKKLFKFNDSLASIDDEMRLVEEEKLNYKMGVKPAESLAIIPYVSPEEVLLGGNIQKEHGGKFSGGFCDEEGVRGKAFNASKDASEDDVPAEDIRFDRKSCVDIGARKSKRSETGYIGLSNQGATCYMNSLLQALFMTADFRASLFKWRYDEEKCPMKKDCIPYQLQKLFGVLQLGNTSYAYTRDLTTSFQWDFNESLQQHDIEEFNKMLFDAVETSCSTTPEENFIKEQFFGEAIDFVQCKNCGTMSERKQPFSDLKLAVRDEFANVVNDSVTKALENYLYVETLEGDNQYACEKCASKQDAFKGTKISKLPPTLTLHIKRFVFDFGTQSRCKLNDKMECPSVLNMNKFIGVTGDDVKRSTKEAGFPPSMSQADYTVSTLKHTLSYDVCARDTSEQLSSDSGTKLLLLKNSQSSLEGSSKPSYYSNPLPYCNELSSASFYSPAHTANSEMLSLSIPERYACSGASFDAQTLSSSNYLSSYWGMSQTGINSDAYMSSEAAEDGVFGVNNTQNGAGDCFGGLFKGVFGGNVSAGALQDATRFNTHTPTSTNSRLDEEDYLIALRNGIDKSSFLPRKDASQNKALGVSSSLCSFNFDGTEHDISSDGEAYPCRTQREAASSASTLKGSLFNQDLQGKSLLFASKDLSNASCSAAKLDVNAVKYKDEGRELDRRKLVDTGMKMVNQKTKAQEEAQSFLAFEAKSLVEDSYLKGADEVVKKVINRQFLTSSSDASAAGSSFDCVLGDNAVEAGWSSATLASSPNTLWKGSPANTGLAAEKRQQGLCQKAQAKSFLHEDEDFSLYQAQTSALESPTTRQIEEQHTKGSLLDASCRAHAAPGTLRIQNLMSNASSTHLPTQKIEDSSSVSDETALQDDQRWKKAAETCIGADSLTEPGGEVYVHSSSPGSPSCTHLLDVRSNDTAGRFAHHRFPLEVDSPEIGGVYLGRQGSPHIFNPPIHLAEGACFSTLNRQNISPMKSTQLVSTPLFSEDTDEGVEIEDSAGNTRHYPYDDERERVAPCSSSSSLPGNAGEKRESLHLHPMYLQEEGGGSIKHLVYPTESCKAADETFTVCDRDYDIDSFPAAGEAGERVYTYLGEPLDSDVSEASEGLESVSRSDARLVVFSTQENEPSVCAWNVEKVMRVFSGLLSTLKYLRKLSKPQEAPEDYPPLIEVLKWNDEICAKFRAQMGVSTITYHALDRDELSDDVLSAPKASTGWEDVKEMNSKGACQNNTRNSKGRVCYIGAYRRPRQQFVSQKLQHHAHCDVRKEVESSSSSCIRKVDCLSYKIESFSPPRKDELKWDSRVFATQQHELCQSKVAGEKEADPARCIPPSGELLHDEWDVDGGPLNNDLQSLKLGGMYPCNEDELHTNQLVKRSDGDVGKPSLDSFPGLEDSLLVKISDRSTHQNPIVCNAADVDFGATLDVEDPASRGAAHTFTVEDPASSSAKHTFRTSPHNADSSTPTYSSSLSSLTSSGIPTPPSYPCSTYGSSPRRRLEEAWNLQKPLKKPFSKAKAGSSAGNFDASTLFTASTHSPSSSQSFNEEVAQLRAQPAALGKDNQPFNTSGPVADIYGFKGGMMAALPANDGSKAPSSMEGLFLAVSPVNLSMHPLRESSVDEKLGLRNSLEQLRMPSALSERGMNKAEENDWLEASSSLEFAAPSSGFSASASFSSLPPCSPPSATHSPAKAEGTTIEPLLKKDSPFQPLCTHAESAIKHYSDDLLDAESRFSHVKDRSISSLISHTHTFTGAEDGSSRGFAALGIKKNEAPLDGICLTHTDEEAGHSNGLFAGKICQKDGNLKAFPPVIYSKEMVLSSVQNCLEDALVDEDCRLPGKMSSVVHKRSQVEGTDEEEEVKESEDFFISSSDRCSGASKLDFASVLPKNLVKSADIESGVLEGANGCNTQLSFLLTEQRQAGNCDLSRNTALKELTHNTHLPRVEASRTAANSKKVWAEMAVSSEREKPQQRCEGALGNHEIQVSSEGFSHIYKGFAHDEALFPQKRQCELYYPPQGGDALTPSCLIFPRSSTETLISNKISESTATFSEHARENVFSVFSASQMPSFPPSLPFDASSASFVGRCSSSSKEENTHNNPKDEIPQEGRSVLLADGVTTVAVNGRDHHKDVIISDSTRFNFLNRCLSPENRREDDSIDVLSCNIDSIMEDYDIEEVEGEGGSTEPPPGSLIPPLFPLIEEFGSDSACEKQQKMIKKSVFAAQATPPPNPPGGSEYPLAPPLEFGSCNDLHLSLRGYTQCAITPTTTTPTASSHVHTSSSCRLPNSEVRQLIDEKGGDPRNLLFEDFLPPGGSLNSNSTPPSLGLSITPPQDNYDALVSQLNETSVCVNHVGEAERLKYHFNPFSPLTSSCKKDEYVGIAPANGSVDVSSSLGFASSSLVFSGSSSSSSSPVPAFSPSSPSSSSSSSSPSSYHPQKPSDVTFPPEKSTSHLDVSHPPVFNAVSTTGESAFPDYGINGFSTGSYSDLRCNTYTEFLPFYVKTSSSSPFLEPVTPNEKPLNFYDYSNPRRDSPTLLLENPTPSFMSKTPALVGNPYNGGVCAERSLNEKLEPPKGWAAVGLSLNDLSAYSMPCTIRKEAMMSDSKEDFLQQLPLFTHTRGLEDDLDCVSSSFAFNPAGDAYSSSGATPFVQAGDSSSLATPSARVGTHTLFSSTSTSASTDRVVPLFQTSSLAGFIGGGGGWKNSQYYSMNSGNNEGGRVEASRDYGIGGGGGRGFYELDYANAQQEAYPPSLNSGNDLSYSATAASDCFGGVTGSYREGGLDNTHTYNSPFDSTLSRGGMPLEKEVLLDRLRSSSYKIYDPNSVLGMRGGNGVSSVRSACPLPSSRATPKRKPCFKHSRFQHSGGEASTGEMSKLLAAERSFLDPDLVKSKILEYSKDGPYVYTLYAILVHSGSALGGHYYAYIKNLATMEWFCFNDCSVMRVHPGDIINSFGSNSRGSYHSGSAYLLMYKQLHVKDNEVQEVRLPNEDDVPPYIMKAVKKMDNREALTAKALLEKAHEIEFTVIRRMPKHCMKGYLETIANSADISSDGSPSVSYSSSPTFKPFAKFDQPLFNSLNEGYEEGGEEGGFSELNGNFDVDFDALDLTDVKVKLRMTHHNTVLELMKRVYKKLRLEAEGIDISDIRLRFPAFYWGSCMPGEALTTVTDLKDELMDSAKDICRSLSENRMLEGDSSLHKIGGEGGVEDPSMSGKVEGGTSGAHAVTGKEEDKPCAFDKNTVEAAVRSNGKESKREKLDASSDDGKDYAKRPRKVSLAKAALNAEFLGATAGRQGHRTSTFAHTSSRWSTSLRRSSLPCGVASEGSSTFDAHTKIGSLWLASNATIFIETREKGEIWGEVGTRMRETFVQTWSSLTNTLSPVRIITYNRFTDTYGDLGRKIETIFGIPLRRQVMFFKHRLTHTTEFVRKLYSLIEHSSANDEDSMKFQMADRRLLVEDLRDYCPYHVCKKTLKTEKIDELREMIKSLDDDSVDVWYPRLLNIVQEWSPLMISLRSYIRNLERSFLIQFNSVPSCMYGTTRKIDSKIRVDSSKTWRELREAIASDIGLSKPEALTWKSYSHGANMPICSILDTPIAGSAKDSPLCSSSLPPVGRLKSSIVLNLFLSPSLPPEHQHRLFQVVFYNPPSVSKVSIGSDYASSNEVAGLEAAPPSADDINMSTKPVKECMYTPPVEVYSPKRETSAVIGSLLNTSATSEDGELTDSPSSTSSMPCKTGSEQQKVAAEVEDCKKPPRILHFDDFTLSPSISGEHDSPCSLSGSGYVSRASHGLEVSIPYNGIFSVNDLKVLCVERLREVENHQVEIAKFRASGKEKRHSTRGVSDWQNVEVVEILRRCSRDFYRSWHDVCADDIVFHPEREVNDLNNAKKYSAKISVDSLLQPLKDDEEFVISADDAAQDKCVLLKKQLPRHLILNLKCNYINELPLSLETPSVTFLVRALLSDLKSISSSSLMFLRESRECTEEYAKLIESLLAAFYRLTPPLMFVMLQRFIIANTKLNEDAWYTFNSESISQLVKNATRFSSIASNDNCHFGTTYILLIKAKSYGIKIDVTRSRSIQNICSSIRLKTRNFDDNPYFGVGEGREGARRADSAIWARRPSVRSSEPVLQIKVKSRREAPLTKKAEGGSSLNGKKVEQGTGGAGPCV